MLSTVKLEQFAEKVSNLASQLFDRSAYVESQGVVDEVRYEIMHKLLGFLQERNASFKQHFPLSIVDLIYQKHGKVV